LKADSRRKNEIRFRGSVGADVEDRLES
jgi:hypothetical protein